MRELSAVKAKGLGKQNDNPLKQVQAVDGRQEGKHL
jgi:hypothetical protein